VAAGVVGGVGWMMSVCMRSRDQVCGTKPRGQGEEARLRTEYDTNGVMQKDVGVCQGTRRSSVFLSLLYLMSPLEYSFAFRSVQTFFVLLFGVIFDHCSSIPLNLIYCPRFGDCSHYR